MAKLRRSAGSPTLRVLLAALLRKHDADWRARCCRLDGVDPGPTLSALAADALDRGEPVEVAGWEVAAACDDHPRGIAWVGRVRVEPDGTIVPIERRADGPPAV